MKRGVADKIFLISSAFCAGLFLFQVLAMASAGAAPRKGQPRGQNPQSRPAQGQPSHASGATQQIDFINRLSQNIHDPEMSEKLSAIAEELKTSGALSQESRDYLMELSGRLNSPMASGALKQIASQPARTPEPAGEEGTWQTQQSKDSDFLRMLSSKLNNASISERLGPIAEEITSSGVLNEDDRNYLGDLSKRIKNEKISGFLSEITDRY